MTTSEKLDKEKVFRLVLEEAFADGRLTFREMDLISDFRRVLNLSHEAHEGIFKETAHRFKSGELSVCSAFDKLGLYRRVLAIADADGVIDVTERHLLDSVCILLGLSDEERSAIEAETAFGSD